MSQTTQAAALHDCRRAFADTLIALAREDERIVAVCNDSVGSSNLTAFKAEFPDRMINVGIAEQDLVGVGAGLANGGLIPFVSAAAPFLTGRALEQIKVDVAYSQAHVVLCGQSPGMAYGELGPTHHSIEDLSWLRAVADLPVAVPADPVQTVAGGPLGRGQPGSELPAHRQVPGARRHAARLALPARPGHPADGRERRHHHRRGDDGLARPGRGRRCCGTRASGRGSSTSRSSSRSTPVPSWPRRPRPPGSSPPRRPPRPAAWARRWPR